MPPGKKLSDDDIETLRIWIEAGAPYPKIDAKEADAAEKAAMAKLEERPITTEERNYWAFQPAKRVTPPKVDSRRMEHQPHRCLRVRCDEGEGAQAVSGRRQQRTLIRRAYLDVTGLPPTPEEVDAFVKDALAGCVAEAGRSAARLPPLRRAMGAPLAGSDALRRFGRI